MSLLLKVILRLLAPNALILVPSRDVIVLVILLPCILFPPALVPSLSVVVSDPIVLLAGLILIPTIVNEIVLEMFDNISKSHAVLWLSRSRERWSE